MHDTLCAVTPIVEMIVMRWCQHQRLHALCSHDQRVADDTLKIAQAGHVCYAWCSKQSAVTATNHAPDSGLRYELDLISIDQQTTSTDVVKCA
jgi:hypothetical protein